MAELDYRGVKVSVPDELAERLPSDYKAASGESKAPAKRTPSK